jgi:integrase
VRGSVVKKGSRWYVKLELDPDPATGRRRQRWHSGYATKREAERARIDLLSKLDRSEYVTPTQQTLGDYLTEWLVTIEPTVRRSTYDSYQRNMHLHVIDHIGATKLARVDAGVLNGLYAKLLGSGRRPSSRKGKGHPPSVVDQALALRREGCTFSEVATRVSAETPGREPLTKNAVAALLRRHAQRCDDTSSRPEGLDPRTVAYVHTILHRAFKDAVRWGRLARNPADAADPPRARPKPDAAQAWDSSTLQRFLEATCSAGDRLYALWVLLATTGMRRGEALGLRWTDLDLEAGRAHVRQTVVQVRGQVSIGEPKTVQGRRAIDLDTWTVTALRTHRVRMAEERLLVGPDFADNGLVFHDPSGAPLRPESVSRSFTRRVAAPGLRPLTVHGLRHTWATLALQNGVHPRVVQERLGHSTIAITLGIYSHVSPTLHAQAAQAVADMMFGVGNRVRPRADPRP